MLSFETVFSIGGSLAMASWVALVFLRRWYIRVIPLVQLIAPVLLSIAYSVLIVMGLSESDGGYGSLAEVRELFTSDAALLAGWLHYLAFDLLVGTWEAKEAHRLNMPHWLLVPCLFLTFMFGPVGWLLFVIVRTRYNAAQTQEALA